MQKSEIKILASGILKFVLIVLLVVLSCVFFVSAEDLETLKLFSLSDLLIVLFVTQIVYAISGLEFAVIVLFNSSVKIGIVDILFLPITMNLWSFLIPFQGSLLYSTCILKYKYNTNITQAVSTSIFSYLFSIILTGLLGVVLTLIGKDTSWIFLLVSLGMFFSPVFLFLAYKVFSLINFSSFQWLKKINAFLQKIVENLQGLFSNIKMVCLIVCTSTAHIIASFFMNYCIARGLHYDIPVFSMLIFTLLIRLSVILKVTPGNVGVQEILSGGIFSALALDPAQGVLITLAGRLITILQMATIGVIDTAYNSRYFGLNKLFPVKEVSSQPEI